MMTGLLVGLARDVCRLWRYNYSLLLYDKRKKKEKKKNQSDIEYRRGYTMGTDILLPRGPEELEGHVEEGRCEKVAEGVGRNRRIV